MASALDYITREKDPRPRCVLVLGDGFTQGFLASQGLHGTIQSRVSGHFENHDLLKYEPVPNEVRMWERRPWRDARFWSEIHWPKLYRRWENDGRPNPSEFYEALAQEHINPTPEGEGVDTGTLAFELRCYLWHMMRSWQRVIWSSVANNGGCNPSWEWFYLLPLLVRKYHLTVVTFNYDEVFRDALWASTAPYPDLEGMAYRRTINRSIQYLENLSSETVVGLHIHGSIAHWVEGPFQAPVEETECPWITDHFVVRDAISLNASTYRLDAKLTKGIPQIPSLLPPGHSGANPGHFTDPRLIGSWQAAWYMNKSDLVIFCGLSGRSPDTKEVAFLARALKRRARVYQVGRDRDVPLTRMLSAHPRYSFLDAAGLMQIMDEIPR